MKKCLVPQWAAFKNILHIHRSIIIYLWIQLSVDQVQLPCAPSGGKESGALLTSSVASELSRSRGCPSLASAKFRRSIGAQKHMVSRFTEKLGMTFLLPCKGLGDLGTFSRGGQAFIHIHCFSWKEINRSCKRENVCSFRSLIYYYRFYSNI